MKSKVAHELIPYMDEGPINTVHGWGSNRSFKHVFHFFLSNFVTQNFYFYIVNLKLQQQWENERPEKKKKILNCIIFYNIFTKYWYSQSLISFHLISMLISLFQALALERPDKKFFSQIFTTSEMFLSCNL